MVYKLELGIRFRHLSLLFLQSKTRNKRKTKKKSEEPEETRSTAQEGWVMEGNLRRCPCGERRVIRTSWTSSNPGRKFWSCDNQSCNRTFEWIEEEVHERARRTIAGLLTSKCRLKIELERSKKSEKRLWLAVIFLILIIIFRNQCGLC